MSRAAAFFFFVSVCILISCFVFYGQLSMKKKATPLAQNHHLGKRTKKRSSKDSASVLTLTSLPSGSDDLSNSVILSPEVDQMKDMSDLSLTVVNDLSDAIRGVMVGLRNRGYFCYQNAAFQMFLMIMRRGGMSLPESELGAGLEELLRQVSSSDSPNIDVDFVREQLAAATGQPDLVNERIQEDSLTFFGTLLEQLSWMQYFSFTLQETVNVTFLDSPLSNQESESKYYWNLSLRDFMSDVPVPLIDVINRAHDISAGDEPVGSRLFSLRLQSVSRFLIFNILRLDRGAHVPTPVEVPDRISLPVGESGQADFNLIGMVEHYPEEEDLVAHYVAHVKHQDQWVTYNDGHAFLSEKSNMPCLIFYEKII